MPRRRPERVDPDRPRERLEALGSEALSDAELVALLLRTGTRGCDALALASELLARHGGLQGLARSGAAGGRALPGLGPAKAATLRACVELGRRLASGRLRAGEPIRQPADVHRHFHARLRHVCHERFLVLLLDGRHRLIRHETVSQGTLTASLVHPREVFRPALREAAAALILVHNHPSGDPTPSAEDRDVTTRLARAGEILGVRVLDHVIVAERGYCSLREEGLLQARLPPSCAPPAGLRARPRPADDAEATPRRGAVVPENAAMPKASVVPLPESEDPPAVERRKSPRADVLVRVDYQTIDEIFSDFARNINEGGLFVETDKPAAIGTEVSLQFRMPGGEDPVMSRGRVVRIAEGGGEEPPGMGIEFDELDDVSRQRINDLVRNLRSGPVRRA